MNLYCEILPTVSVRRLIQGLLLMILALWAAPVQAQQYVFYSQNLGQTVATTTTFYIGLANANTGAVVNDTWLTTGADPWGVAVDGTNIYWANQGDQTIGYTALSSFSTSGPTGTVHNAWIDATLGGNFSSTVVSGVASDGTYVYWADSANNIIGRALISDTTGASAAVYITCPNKMINSVSTAASPRGVKVYNGNIYWTLEYDGGNGNGAVGMAVLGSNSVTSQNDAFIPGLNDPTDLVVNSEGIFTSNDGDSTIGRYTLGGATVSATYVTGCSNIIALCAANQIYWGGPAFLGEANQDGTGNTTNFITGSAGTGFYGLAYMGSPSLVVASNLADAGTGSLAAGLNTYQEVVPDAFSYVLSSVDIALTGTVTSASSVAIYGQVPDGVALPLWTLAPGSQLGISNVWKFATTGLVTLIPLTPYYIVYAPGVDTAQVQTTTNTTYAGPGSLVGDVYTASGNLSTWTDAAQGFELIGLNYASSTVITLTSFTATAPGNKVLVAWKTGSEVDTAGFNIWRSAVAGGPFTKVNSALIPAQGVGLGGASYAWTDSAVTAGQTWYYRLEDINTSGVSTFHGPVSVTVGANSPILAFTATPTDIFAGGGSLLTWSVTGSPALTLTGNGTVSGTSLRVTPKATTSYTLADAAGDHNLVTVNVKPFGLLDLPGLSLAWGSVLGDANYNPSYDLNGDGIIDDADVALCFNGL